MHHRLRQHGGSGGAVAGDVVGLAGGLFDQLCAHVLEGIREVDVARDRHAIVGDNRGAKLAREPHVAALGAEGHFHGIGDGIDARQQGFACLVGELKVFRHQESDSFCVSGSQS